MFSWRKTIISRFCESRELLSLVTTLPEAENNLSEGADSFWLSLPSMAEQVPIFNGVTGPSRPKKPC